MNFDLLTGSGVYYLQILSLGAAPYYNLPQSMMCAFPSLDIGLRGGRATGGGVGFFGVAAGVFGVLAGGGPWATVLAGFSLLAKRQTPWVLPWASQ